MNPFQKAMLGNLETPDSSSPIENPSAQNNQQTAKGKVQQQSDALKRVAEIMGLWKSSNGSQNSSDSYQKSSKQNEYVPMKSTRRVFAGGYYDVDPETGELQTEAEQASKQANENIQSFVNISERLPTLGEHMAMNPNVGQIFGARPFTHSTDPRRLGQFQIYERARLLANKAKQI
jgi:hypothetical protein